MPTAIVLLEQYIPSIANRELATIQRRYHTTRKMLFPLVTARGLELLLSKPEGRLQKCVPAYEMNLCSWAPSSQCFKRLNFRCRHISPWNSLSTQTCAPKTSFRSFMCSTVPWLVTAEGWRKPYPIAISIDINICISNVKSCSRHKWALEGAESHKGPSAGAHGQVQKQYCFQQGTSRGVLIVFSVVSLPLP